MGLKRDLLGLGISIGMTYPVIKFVEYMWQTYDPSRDNPVYPGVFESTVILSGIVLFAEALSVGFFFQRSLQRT